MMRALDLGTRLIIQEHQVKSKDSNDDFYIFHSDVLFGSICQFLECPMGASGLIDSNYLGVHDEAVYVVDIEHVEHCPRC